MRPQIDYIASVMTNVARNTTAYNFVSSHVQKFIGLMSLLTYSEITSSTIRMIYDDNLKSLAPIMRVLSPSVFPPLVFLLLGT